MATDVLARGIDVPAVTLVVNYEVPVLFEQGTRYRTGVLFFEQGTTTELN